MIKDLSFWELSLLRERLKMDDTIEWYRLNSAGEIPGDEEKYESNKKMLDKVEKEIESRTDELKAKL